MSSPHIAPSVRRASNHGLGRLVADAPVRMKILGAMAIVAVLAIVVGLVGANAIRAANQALHGVKQHNVDSLAHLADLRGGLTDVNDGLQFFMAAQAHTDASLTKMGQERYRVGVAEVDAALAVYRTTTVGSKQRQKLTTILTTAWHTNKALQSFVVLGEPLPPGLSFPPGPQGLKTLTSASSARDQALTGLAKAEQGDAQVAVDTASATYRRALWEMISVLLAGLVLALVVGIWITNLIIRPLREVSAALDSVADGDLTQEVLAVSRDEVGQMAGSVNRATAAVREVMGTLSTSASALASSSASLSGIADHIASSAQETSNQAATAAIAAGLVSSNVQTVAAGSEEIGASIREISQNASDGAVVAAKAVGVAEATNETVTKLGESSAQIGSVVRVITSIAEQTNLLALNATIEAARAGDAGKGFAVVAGEVKELAQETARATKDISDRVEAIQSDTASAVAAIAEITQIIGRINDYQVTITSAVEEQSNTTAKMNRNVTEAADGSTQIASSITNMATAADVTFRNVTESQQAARDLTQLSTDLKQLVARFRI